MKEDHTEEELLSKSEANRFYEEGKACMRDGDLVKAAELMTKADINGCEKTEILFHFQFDSGMKKRPISPQMIDIIRISAENGYAPAQYSLGARYRAGLSVKKDREKAFYWFNQAAERNEVNALAHLGDMYYKGRHVEEDHAKAFDYYKRAADLGYAPAQFMVGKYYENGDVIDYNPDEAMKYFRMSHEGGYSIATNHLGMKYEEGKLVQRDYKKAYEYYTETADIGNISGYYGLFRCYYFGLYVQKNLETAAYWARRVPEQMGFFNLLRSEVGFDEAKSFMDDYDLYKRAEYYLVGKELEENNDGKPDVDTIIDYYLRSGDAGYAIGFYKLGKIYEEGILVPKDLDMALEYYMKARKMGYRPADYRIDNLENGARNEDSGQK